MKLAKIIRHRHKICKYLNDDLKSVEEDVHYKYVFSDPAEMQKMQDILGEYGGHYDYIKEENKQVGPFPDGLKDILGEDICWCDCFTYIVLEKMGYQFHSIIASPYKGEIYIKN